MVCFGGGSAKKNGVYDAVCEILQANGKKSMRMAESCQILPWKSCGKAVTLHEKIRWISYWQLEAASVCDYAKAVSVSIHCEEDPWRILFADGGCIL